MLDNERSKLLLCCVKNLAMHQHYVRSTDNFFDQAIAFNAISPALLSYKLALIEGFYSANTAWLFCQETKHQHQLEHRF